MKVQITKVLEAEVPEDGGKWALICEHWNEDYSDWTSEGIIQDTSKKRLGEWRTAKWEDGLTQWCCTCQEAHWQGAPR